MVSEVAPPEWPIFRVPPRLGPSCAKAMRGRISPAAVIPAASDATVPSAFHTVLDTTPDASVTVTDRPARS